MMPAARAKETNVRGLRSDLPSEKPERSTSICAGDSVPSLASSALGSSVLRSLIIMLLSCSSLDCLRQHGTLLFIVYGFCPAGQKPYTIKSDPCANVLE